MSILVNEDTTFIVQGITGREAVNLTRECLDYGAGAKVVGGVTPGRLGREVHGVPVFDTVQQAVAHHGGPIDGSVVTVPPAFTKDAVFEAIESGVKIIVIVTERIPRYDVAQMVELANLRGARIIGPNCLGLIVPGVAKMGGIGGPAKDAAKAYSPGPVGVMSRSGGMTTEISSTLTAAGLGVSTAISIGGDAIIGSTYAELMPYFEEDEETEAIEAGVKLIVIVTERIPRFDVAQMVELADMRGARIIGPNCLGLIVPEVCKMGGIGGPAKDAAKAYAPGPVGVMSRSGGMTTEISSSSMKRPAMKATIGSRESLAATHSARCASIRPPGSV